jgi:hypothetical protein
MPKCLQTLAAPEFLLFWHRQASSTPSHHHWIPFPSPIAAISLKTKSFFSFSWSLQMSVTVNSKNHNQTSWNGWITDYPAQFILARDMQCDENFVPVQPAHPVSV